MKLSLSRLASYPAPVRIGAFFLGLLLLWVPIAVPISLLVTDRNTASILSLLSLYVTFILLVRFWGQRVYRQPALLRHYGLEFSRRMSLEVLAGLAIGSVSLLALFATQGAFGWVIWRPPSIALLRVAGEGLLVALGIGFAEELCFRGWLLDELQRDYHPAFALWLDATIFALVHGIKPQFLALLLLGLALVWAKRSCTDVDTVLPLGGDDRQKHGVLTRNRGRLGLPMGLHAGLVWGYYMVNVGNLIEYSPQVPTWLTGIDRNPLAGAIGLLFLSALAFGLRRYARRVEAVERL